MTVALSRQKALSIKHRKLSTYVSEALDNVGLYAYGDTAGFHQ